MQFEERFRRRRELAAIEARTLVSMHQITRAEVEAIDKELAARREALAEPIGQIQALMTLHDISIADLLDEGPAAGAVTHRHPTTGEDWTGIGPQPDWIRRALLVEGLRPSDLRVA